MNSLSWMIYWAGVCNGVQTLLGVVGGFLIASMCFYSLIAFMDHAELKVAKCFRSVSATGVFLILVSILIPDRNTLYAIAASEYGEEALKTPEASKARAALNAWLDKQIHDAKPEK